MSSKYKPLTISFCTTSMNRLYHLRETLPENIRNCLSYGNVEFVVLNYSSRDEIDTWMEEEMREYIDSGLLKYLKVGDIPFWDNSHAKNIVARHAAGDLFCGIDADNYIKEGFPDWLNRHFQEDPETFCTGRNRLRHGDSSGRVCCWRRDFLEIRGYDEELNGYGFEDIDLYTRLAHLDRREVILDIEWLDTIPHSDLERVQNTRIGNNVELVLLQDRLPDKCAEKISYIIMADHSFERIFLVLSGDPDSPATICIDDRRRGGGWEHKDGGLQLTFTDGETVLLTPSEDGEKYLQGEWDYEKMTGEEHSYAIYLYMLLSNEHAFRKKAGASKAVNINGFGKAAVFQPVSPCKIGI
jgi:hypothetical protein